MADRCETLRAQRQQPTCCALAVVLWLLWSPTVLAHSITGSPLDGQRPDSCSPSTAAEQGRVCQPDQNAANYLQQQRESRAVLEDSRDEGARAGGGNSASWPGLPLVLMLLLALVFLGRDQRQDE